MELAKLMRRVENVLLVEGRGDGETDAEVLAGVEFATVDDALPSLVSLGGVERMLFVRGRNRDHRFLFSGLTSSPTTDDPLKPRMQWPLVAEKVRNRILGAFQRLRE